MALLCISTSLNGRPPRGDDLIGGSVHRNRFWRLWGEGPQVQLCWRAGGGASWSPSHPVRSAEKKKHFYIHSCRFYVITVILPYVTCGKLSCDNY